MDFDIHWAYSITTQELTRCNRMMHFRSIVISIMTIHFFLCLGDKIYIPRRHKGGGLHLSSLGSFPNLEYDQHSLCGWAANLHQNNWCNWYILERKRIGTIWETMVMSKKIWAVTTKQNLGMNSMGRRQHQQRNQLQCRVQVALWGNSEQTTLDRTCFGKGFM